MKKRVLKAKANKKVMRVISSAAALRPRDPVVVLLDSSFTRFIVEQGTKGGTGGQAQMQQKKKKKVGAAAGNFNHRGDFSGIGDAFRTQLTECLGDASALRLIYTTSTANILQKTNPECLSFLERQQAECIDAYEEEQKREGRSVYEAVSKCISGASSAVNSNAANNDGQSAAQKRKGHVQLPSGSRPKESLVRHVFVATQSHDIKKELQRAFPPSKKKQQAIPDWKKNKDVSTAYIPSVDDVGCCSIIRATNNPFAIWVDFLNDIQSTAGSSSSLSSKPTAASISASTAAAMGAAPSGPTISDADAAFMAKMAVKVPTSNPSVLSTKVNRKLVIAQEAQEANRIKKLELRFGKKYRAPTENEDEDGEEEEIDVKELGKMKKSQKLLQKKKLAQQHQDVQLMKKKAKDAGISHQLVAAANQATLAGMNPLAHKKKQTKEKLIFTSTPSTTTTTTPVDVGSKKKKRAEALLEDTSSTAQNNDDKKKKVKDGEELQHKKKRKEDSTSAAAAVAVTGEKKVKKESSMSADVKKSPKGGASLSTPKQTPINTSGQKGDRKKVPTTTTQAVSTTASSQKSPKQKAMSLSTSSLPPTAGAPQKGPWADNDSDIEVPPLLPLAATATPAATNLQQKEGDVSSKKAGNHRGGRRAKKKGEVAVLGSVAELNNKVSSAVNNNIPPPAAIVVPEGDLAVPATEESAEFFV